jgi:DNA-directed RNA polymerase alpha subunit
MDKEETMQIDILLQKLARPAQRAIQNAGITTLEQLSKLSEEEVFALHGIGKNAMAIIKLTLKENGLSFTQKQ